jgi:hypothetical protein
MVLRVVLVKDIDSFQKSDAVAILATLSSYIAPSSLAFHTADMRVAEKIGPGGRSVHYASLPKSDLKRHFSPFVVTGSLCLLALIKSVSYHLQENLW